MTSFGKVNDSLIIQIQDSYFGTTDLDDIANRITDQNEDYTLGTVSILNPVSDPIDITVE